MARIEIGETNPTVRTLDRLFAAAGWRLDVSVSPARTFADELRRFFRETDIPGVVSAYLFGSRARGEGHRESDVDVGVLLDRDTYRTRSARGDLRVRLSAELVAAAGANDVDLVVLNDAPPGLAARVVVDGERLFVADPEADHRFVRDTLLRWGDLRPFLRRTAAVKLEAPRR